MEMATYRHWSVSLWRDQTMSHIVKLSNPVPWQNWMAAYIGYTLRIKTLFRGWPIMVNDTHTRRRELTKLALKTWLIWWHNDDVQTFLVYHINSISTTSLVQLVLCAYILHTPAYYRQMDTALGRDIHGSDHPYVGPSSKMIQFTLSKDKCSTIASLHYWPLKVKDQRKQTKSNHFWS